MSAILGYMDFEFQTWIVVLLHFFHCLSTMEHTISHYLLALWEVKGLVCIDIDYVIAQTKRQGVFAYAVLRLMEHAFWSSKV